MEQIKGKQTKMSLAGKGHSHLKAHFISQVSEIPVHFSLCKRASQRTLKMLSFNILAQHLVDGEQPSYKQLNKEGQEEALREVRLNLFKQFLNQPDIQDFDILNLQEIGPLDEVLINEVVADLKSKSKNGYEFLIAQYATGGQKLHVGIIINKDKIKIEKREDLTQTKENKTTQFGIFLTLNHKNIGQLFLINVHLTGGAAQKDEAARDVQLDQLAELECFRNKDSKVPVILAGDFNTEFEPLYEKIQVKLGKEISYQFQDKPKLQYNTENRIQYRNRSGWAGVQIIERVVDAVFFKNLKLKGHLVTQQKFDQLLKREKLEELKKELAQINNIENEKEKNEKTEEFVNKLKTDEEEVGFPSKYWFSDHLPVGAIFKPKL